MFTEEYLQANIIHLQTLIDEYPEKIKNDSVHEHAQRVLYTAKNLDNLLAENKIVDHPILNTFLVSGIKSLVVNAALTQVQITILMLQRNIHNQHSDISCVSQHSNSI